MTQERAPRLRAQARFHVVSWNARPRCAQAGRLVAFGYLRIAIAGLMVSVAGRNPVELRLMFQKSLSRNWSVSPPANKKSDRRRV